MTQKQDMKLEAWAAWGRRMAFLREIHRELDSQRTDMINYGSFYRLRNEDLEGRAA